MYNKLSTTRFKSGKRTFLSVPTASMRSQWECHIALWLDYIKVKWEYEAYRFDFAEGTRGAKSYLPDFYIPKYKPTKTNGLPDLGLTDCYLECKGYLTSRARMQIVHFQRDYPEQAKKLVAITYSPNAAATKYYNKKGIPILAYYKDLEKNFSHILHWGD